MLRVDDQLVLPTYQATLSATLALIRPVVPLKNKKWQSPKLS